MTTNDDLRTFIREILLRYDRGIAVALENLAAVREEQRAHREENRVYFETLRAHADAEARRTDDVIAENRAQRAALLRILDQLKGNGGTATAG
jgi:hypothetical protein